MSPTLIAIAAQVGAPLVRRILERRIGADNAALAEEIVGAIAHRAGVDPARVEDLAATDPEAVAGAIRAVEEASPELLALYTDELEAKARMIAREDEGSWFRWAWRPGLMWTNIGLWLWQIIVLHVLNAIFRIALPPAPWDALILFTTITTGLYMGGHTAKAVMATWRGGKA